MELGFAASTPATGANGGQRGLGCMPLPSEAVPCHIGERVWSLRVPSMERWVGAQAVRVKIRIRFEAKSIAALITVQAYLCVAHARSAECQQEHHVL